MTGSATLSIDVLREEGSRSTIVLEGELDASTAGRLKQTLTTLIDEGYSDVVVDMERLYLMDSAALGALVSARQRIPGRLRLQNPSPTVRRILETTGLSRILEVVEDEANQQQLLNFDLRIEDTPRGIPIVHVRGELDAYSVSHFRGALVSLAQEGHTTIVMDLSELDFVDSMGLGGMVSVYTHLRKAGGTLFLAQPSEQISKVLRITGLDSLFPIHPTCEAAVAFAQRWADR